MDLEQKSFLKRFIPISAFIGGLCCFTPLVLVFFGLSTVSFASSLADNLYGNYKWLFRGIAIIFLGLSLVWYFYKKEKICSINEAVKKRKRIINFILVTIISLVLTYIFWLYVVVELIGIGFGIW